MQSLHEWMHGFTKHALNCRRHSPQARAAILTGMTTDEFDIHIPPVPAILNGMVSCAARARRSRSRLCRRRRRR